MDTDPYDDVLPVTRDRLVKRRLPERDVEIEGVGTVRVRGLSRAEVIDMRAKQGQPGDLEVELLTRGLVDPVLTPAEVDQWREASPAGELEVVSNAILELSGMLPVAVKEAVKTFREQSGEAPGVPSGPDVGDDRG